MNAKIAVGVAKAIKQENDGKLPKEHVPLSRGNTTQKKIQKDTTK